jgi:hypothetical protein
MAENSSEAALKVHIPDYLYILMFLHPNILMVKGGPFCDFWYLSILILTSCWNLWFHIYFSGKDCYLNTTPQMKYTQFSKTAILMMMK